MSINDYFVQLFCTIYFEGFNTDKFGTQLIYGYSMHIVHNKLRHRRQNTNGNLSSTCG